MYTIICKYTEKHEHFTRSVRRTHEKTFTGRVGSFLCSPANRASCQYPAEPGKTRPHLPVIPRRANRFTRILVRIGLLFEEPPRFTLDPCLHSGTYYVQEASSMFLHHIFGQILPAHPVRVLDLCAAPGGKSTLIATRLSSGSLLVANEVIRSRAGILKENMIKWGTSHVVVTNNDPADFHHLKGAFDIIVVDAPCSGEGMFRNGTKATCSFAVSASNGFWQTSGLA